jgi:hypothetical protein
MNATETSAITTEARRAQRSMEYIGDFGKEFIYLRVLRPADIPPLYERIVDVAVLDMNCRWPNLGHDLMVRTVGEIAHDLSPLLQSAEMQIRVLSYDVRGSLMVPEPPGARHQIYMGTGGPGHINPHLNDGVSEGTQGIREDASWEAPLFRLFDDIRENERAVLLAVCHTFGVLCRWANVAEPVLRSRRKGGKSAGILENVLTLDACRHPWFSRFAAQLPDRRHLSVVDNRFFDLIPDTRRFPPDMTPIGYESFGPDGRQGDAVTMLEFARDRGGIMPRMFAVNHHPEVRDSRRQLWILQQKLSRGEVFTEWYEERARTLREGFSSPDAERRILLTSQYTLLAPLRFHLYRQVRLKAASLGCDVDLHEEQVLHSPSGTLEREEDFPL